MRFHLKPSTAAKGDMPRRLGKEGAIPRRDATATEKDLIEFISLQMRKLFAPSPSIEDRRNPEAGKPRGIYKWGQKWGGW